MIEFKASAVAVVKIAALACVATICAAVVYLLVSLMIQPRIRMAALSVVGLQNFGLVLESDDKTYRPDIEPVFNDHESVKSWLFDCRGYQGRDQVPDTLSWEVNFQPGIGIYAEYNPDKKNDDKLKPLIREERALVDLSKSLASQRLSLATKARSAYTFWEITSLITIVLGLITTVLVSISSTNFGQGDGTRQKTIRVLAIVFPALGTASAAIIAFYSPQAEWSQAARTLASEAQLHGQIRLGVWHLKCPNTPDDTTKLATQVDEWAKRFVDIQTVAASSGSTTNGPASGTTPKTEASPAKPNPN